MRSVGGGLEGLLTAWKQLYEIFFILHSAWDMAFLIFNANFLRCGTLVQNKNRKTFIIKGCVCKGEGGGLGA